MNTIPLNPDAPMGSFLAEIAVRLADEGVPISAIGRAIKHSYSSVFRTVQNAISEGRIVDMPSQDWSPKMPRKARDGFVSVAVPEYTQVVLNAVTTFRVTPLQARVLATLLRNNHCTREMLHAVVEQSRDPTKDTTNPKIVDVVICHLRKRIKKFSIEVKTIWSCGYHIEPHHRELAMQLMGMLPTPVLAPDTPPPAPELPPVAQAEFELVPRPEPEPGDEQPEED